MKFLLVLHLFTLTYTQKIIICDQFLDIFASKETDPIFTNIAAQIGTSTILEHMDDPIGKICSTKLKTAAMNALKELSLLGVRSNSSEFKNIEYIHDHKRQTRGLRFLGELFSSLTETGSPDEFDHLQSLTKKLKQAAIDQNEEVKSVELVVKNDHSMISRIKTALNIMNKEKSHNALVLNDTEIMLKHYFESEKKCKLGEAIDHVVQDEIRIVWSISNDAKSNKPNIFLFPPKNIKKIIKNHKNGDLKVLFESNNHNILYGMNCAVTSIHGKEIVSVMRLPLVNYNQMKNVVYLNYNSKNKKRFAELENFSDKKLDILICNKNIRFGILMSAVDLIKCQKNSASDFYICKKRIIHLYNDSPEFCTEKFKAKVIVFERSLNSFVIEKNAGSVQIICTNKLFKTIQVNKTTVINLPAKCMAKNLHFEIKSFNEQNIIEANETDYSSKFEIVDITPEQNIDFKEYAINDLEIKVSNTNDKLEQHDEEIDRMSDKADKSNKDMEELKNDKYPHVMAGISIGLSSTSFVVLVPITILFVYLYLRLSKKYRKITSGNDKKPKKPKNDKNEEEEEDEGEDS